MQGGYMNRILRVDLSNRTWTTEELDENLSVISLEEGVLEPSFFMTT